MVNAVFILAGVLLLIIFGGTMAILGNDIQLEEQGDYNLNIDNIADYGDTGLFSDIQRGFNLIPSVVAYLILLISGILIIGGTLTL